jgi:hypothetical protein
MLEDCSCDLTLELALTQQTRTLWVSCFAACCACVVFGDWTDTKGFRKWQWMSSLWCCPLLLKVYPFEKLDLAHTEAPTQQTRTHCVFCFAAGHTYVVLWVVVCTYMGSGGFKTLKYATWFASPLLACSTSCLYSSATSVRVLHCCLQSVVHCCF